ncbi:hypothetical protein M758_5G070900 [Ceratodon purpureus]|nr:hypothetical protein M758_5G070900 [Ceratodon purpureus]
MGYLSCRTEAALGTCENAHQKQKRQRQRPVNPQIFSFSQLQLATRNFAEDCLLGKGSHGLVYKGVLEDGKQVAIKRATYARQLLQDESSFDNELEILSKIWSDKLVNLLGYTRDEDEKLLVVEFMSNGTLHDNLHDSFSPLSWTMRIHLALQIAKGVLALHSASPPIIHRDIKSSNVLIDEKWNAKLGDFGLALRGHIEDMLKTSTPPAGTMGYLDPEYETPSDLSTKTDVFSFGILLLEIISGRNAIDLAYEPPSILDWALPLIKQGKINEILDKKIPVPGNTKPLKLMINLAIKCVRTSRYRRPSMFDVVEDLKDIYRKVSLSSLESLTRVVRKGVNAQRPWPTTSARRAKVSSYPHHKRLLSQVSRLAERDASLARVAYSEDGGSTAQNCADEPALPEGEPPRFCAHDGDGNSGVADGITDEPRVSTPFATDCSEVESETALDDFMSANASFRSSSASASVDLDDEICEDDALSSATWLKLHPVKPRSRVGAIGKRPSTPLSPCISPGASRELGVTSPSEACNMNEVQSAEDYATAEPLCEIPQVQDLIISQYDLVEHPVSRCSSRGSGSVRSNQALRLLELQDAQLKAMNDVFKTGSMAGGLDGDVRRSDNANEVDVCSLPNEDTGAARRTAYVAIKTLATTCLGAALRPCVRLKEEDELTTTTYLVGTQK